MIETKEELACKTIEILNEGGWIQYHYTNEEGAHCLYGAIYAAISPYEDAKGQLVLDLDAALKAIIVDRYDTFMYGGLIAWNDRPGRTKDEVIAVLEAVCA